MAVKVEYNQANWDLADAFIQSKESCGVSYGNLTGVAKLSIELHSSREG